MSKRLVIEQIRALYEQRGQRQYGENVTELQHALQCADLAQQAGEAPTLVAACLLHDYGHLLHELGEDIADHGIDAGHETLGAEALAAFFPPAVVQPIRLHVLAKRFLCCQQPNYLKALSAASQQSLLLQGGPLTHLEAYEFLQTPFQAEAVRLRRYDEAAKVAERVTPPFSVYEPLLTELINEPKLAVTLR